MTPPFLLNRGLPRETDHTIDGLTAELTASGDAEVSKLFTTEGARPPRIVWSPCERDLSHPLIARFAHICREQLHTDGNILAEDLQFSSFSPVERWVMTLDLDSPDGEFVFRYFGRGIADSFGEDMSGRPVSDLAPHIWQFYTALYRAACRRKEWFYTEHEPPRQIFVQTWQRLFVPLFDRSGNVSKFIALNYPENGLRAGLEIVPDPVFVADEDMIVRFANRSARETFGQSPERPGPRSLREHIGTSITVPKSASEMLRTDSIENRIISLRIGESLEGDFLITVSATCYAGRNFYVVVVHPVASGL